MPFDKNGKPSNCRPWNKGTKGLQVAWNKGLTKETNESVKKYVDAQIGHLNYNTELKGCFKKGNVPSTKGKGKDRYWNKQAYIDLRKKMFAKANYTCLACGQVGGKLSLHHLKPVSLFPGLVYKEENVIVLCIKCHSYTDTWGLRLVRKRDEFKESLSEITLSQVREETLEKVQRLVAEAKVNDYASNAATSVLTDKVRDSLTLQATVRSEG